MNYRQLYAHIPKVFPYPAGLHATEFVEKEPDRDVVTYGLETMVVSITNEGLDAIRRVLGQQFITENIAVRLFESRKQVPMADIVAARAALKDLTDMHRGRVAYELADELARSIEPRPIREGQ